MKKQAVKKYILIASCVMLFIAIIYRGFLNDNKEDGGGIHQEKTDKETILSLEAWRMLDYLAAAEREEHSGEMTCGEFRDALYLVCGLLDISYEAAVSRLPERLYEVAEGDVLYLEEFLYVYSLLIEDAKASGKAVDINEKHVYIYAHTDMPLESSEKPSLVTTEGDYLTIGNALDYSDVIKYFGEINNSSEAEDADEKKEAEKKEEVERKEADEADGPEESIDTGLTEKPYIRGYEDRLMTADACQDKSFRVLCSENEIIYFIEETNEQFVLHNAWVAYGKDKDIRLFAEGFEREISSKKLSEEITDSVADITVQSGLVVGITVKQGAVNGKVLMADDKYIEIEGYGKLLMDPYMRIYKIYGELGMEQTNMVLVGYTNTNFIIIDGKICAALITQRITAENIRVLIKTDNFTSNFHETVIFTSNRSFTVKQGEKETKHAAGEEVSVTKSDMESGRITVIPESENAKIQLLSVRRSYGNPSYRGTIEIADSGDGLIIINDLPLEEYLYAVVPSEMPASYGLEALKAQAVCARSYAYNHLMSNQYRAYGAHVDDSVSYQVYNNIAEDEKAVLAVKETYGMVMEYEGSVITAFYFSTSAGHTADVEDVWENGAKTPYLTGSYQASDKPYIDFSNEETFRDFILENPISLNYGEESITEKPVTYDTGYSYYRWKVVISSEALTKRINDILYSRYQANKSSILTQVTEVEAASGSQSDTAIKTMAGRTFVSKPVKSIGTIKNITVLERGTSGIIKELMIEGENETILVSYQTNVRMLLAPVSSELTRSDKTTSASMSMLPSAYCFIDKINDDGKTAFSITGGGYGHGTGMSQNGAKTMALEGKNFKEILGFYYPGINLTLIYTTDR